MSSAWARENRELVIVGEQLPLWASLWLRSMPSARHIECGGIAAADELLTVLDGVETALLCGIGNGAATIAATCFYADILTRRRMVGIMLVSPPPLDDAMRDLLPHCAIPCRGAIVGYDDTARTWATLCRLPFLMQSPHELAQSRWDWGVRLFQELWD